MRVRLFPTCLPDQCFADEAEAAHTLLLRLGVEVAVVPDLVCCGQPAWNAGFAGEAARLARRALRRLEGDEQVVLLSGSCTSMIRIHYTTLLAGSIDQREAVDALAARTHELSEFLVDVLGIDRIGNGLAGRRVAYHHGCHARSELGIQAQPLRLLTGAGAEVVPWEAAEECCGFGGLFAVKLPEVSTAMADRKIDTLLSPEGLPADQPRPDVLTSADGGCLLHLEGRLRRRGLPLPVRHLAGLLLEGCHEG